MSGLWRSSPTAANRKWPWRLPAARGACLRNLRFSTLTELPLASGRRADVVALAADGTIVIVEIKSSLADFRADQKWPDYRAHCDRLYFAISDNLAPEIMPGGSRVDRRRCFWRGGFARGAGASAPAFDAPCHADALRACRGASAAWVDRPGDFKLRAAVKHRTEKCEAVFGQFRCA